MRLLIDDGEPCRENRRHRERMVGPARAVLSARTVFRRSGGIASSAGA